MILILFGFLALISLVLIVLGLIKTEHTELSIIGFFFLFLLSLIIINGNLEYPIGETEFTHYQHENYTIGTPAEYFVVIHNETTTLTYTYSNFNDTTSHRFGYWLAIGSAVAMFGVLFGLKNKKVEND